MKPITELEADHGQNAFDAAADQAAAIIDSEEARQTVEIDGELYFADTGEFAGVPKGGGYLPEQLQTHEDVELFMERLLHSEATAAAEEMRLNAIISNCERLLKRHKSKIDWLRRVYGPQAEAFALAALPRKSGGELKSKTWRCPYGSIAFSDEQPKLKINKDSEPLAVEFAEKSGFDDCVKIVKSFLISKLPADQEKKFLENPELATANGFEVIGQRLVPSIKTGIKNAKQSSN